MSSVLDLAISISLADHISSGIRSVIGQFRLLENASDDVRKKLEAYKNMAYIGGAVAAIGAVGVAGLQHLADKAGEVQMKLIQLGGVYGLDIDDSRLKEIEQQAQEMSQKTIFSKKENLEISLELAHAGLTKEALKKVVPEATFLAEIEVGMGKSGSATQTAYNFARMAEDAGITADTKRMQQFADDMYRVVNVTHANSESLGEAFKYSMPVVKNLGWTEQDNLLATAMASRAGVEGSMAGTHIKDFAQRTNPFKYLDTRGGQKQLKAMAEAGLLEGIHEVVKKSGKTEIVGFDSAALLKDKDHLKSYAEMVDILSEKYHQFLDKGGGGQEYLSELSEEQIKSIQQKSELMTGQSMSGGALQWAALMNHIFGEQGQDFAIITSHKEMFDKLKKQMDIQKSLHEQIEVIRNSFVGQTHILHGQIETIGLQFGKPIMEAMVPALRIATDALGDLIGFFDKHQQLTKFIAVLAGGLSTFMLIGGSIAVTVGAFGMLKMALLNAGISFGKIALYSGGTVLAIAAIAGAAYLIYKNWDEISPYAKAVWSSVKESAESAWNWLKTNVGPSVGAVWITFKNTFDKLKAFLSEHRESIKKLLGFTGEGGEIKWHMPGWMKLLAGGFILDKLVIGAPKGLANIAKLLKPLSWTAKLAFKIIGSPARTIMSIISSVGKLYTILKFIPGVSGISKIASAVKVAWPIFLRVADAAKLFGSVLLKLGWQALVAGGRIAAAWIIGLGPLAWGIAIAIAVIGFFWAAWRGNWGHIREHFAASVQWIKDKWKAVEDWGSKAIEWGKNLVKSFADGILAGIDWVEGAVTKVGGKIADFLHLHSPAKVGPLSTLNSWFTPFVPTLLTGMDANGKQIIASGADVAGNLATGINSEQLKAIAAAQAVADKVINTIKSAFGIQSPSTVFKNIGTNMLEGLVNGLNSVDIKEITQKIFGEIPETVSGILSKGVNLGGNVTSWLTQALQATNTPMSWLSGLQRLVQAESSGNPAAINSRAVGREHATGLLQTLPSTFRANALPGMNNIMNPVDNAAAAINYIKSRYGSVYNTPLFKGGNYVGYAEGGIVTNPQVARIAEAGAEAIIPLSSGMRGRALEIFRQVGHYFGMPMGTVEGSDSVQAAISNVSNIGYINKSIGTLNPIDNIKTIINHTMTILRSGNNYSSYNNQDMFSDYSVSKTGLSGTQIGQLVTVINNIPAAGNITAYANGGVISSPHMGLVGEAGPEVIIPLSLTRRGRALELWQRAGEMIGVPMHAEGGFFGGVRNFMSNAWDGVKGFFGSEKIQSSANNAEYASISLESSRGGYEKAVHEIHKDYVKKISRVSTIEEAEKIRRIAHDAKNLSRRFSAITKSLSRIAVPLALFASAAEVVGASDKKQTLIKELGSTLGSIAGGALAGAAGGALVGAGLLTPITALVGAAGGAAVGAFGGQALSSNMYSNIARYASGTDSASGGLAWVGEKGPELMNVPRGSQIVPNHRLPDLGRKTEPRINITISPGAIVINPTPNQSPREIAKEVLREIKRELGFDAQQANLTIGRYTSFQGV